MSFTTTSANDILASTFNGTAFPTYGAPDLWIALLTASPTAAGVWTNEAAFGSYARQSLVATTVGWTVTGNQATNATVVTFPTASSGPETETYLAVTTTSTLGSGEIIAFAQLTNPIPVTTGTIIQFGANEINITLT